LAGHDCANFDSSVLGPTFAICVGVPRSFVKVATLHVSASARLDERAIFGRLEARSGAAPFPVLADLGAHFAGFPPYDDWGPAKFDTQPAVFFEGQ